MTTIDKARDLLNPGEKALVLLTRGHQLSINADKSGYTGNWVVDHPLSVDRVVIYLRPNRAGSRADIFLADFVASKPSDEERRFVIEFQNARRIGTSFRTWPEFAEGSQNPVRYL